LRCAERRDKQNEREDYHAKITTSVHHAWTKPRLRGNVNVRVLRTATYNLFALFSNKTSRISSSPHHIEIEWSGPHRLDYANKTIIFQVRNGSIYP